MHSASVSTQARQRTLLTQLRTTALLITTLGSGAAMAQPEMHGYVEPCTVSFVEDGNTSCEECTPTHEDPEHCANELGPRGYEKKCQTGGHSVPGEVWCRPKSTADEQPRVAVLGAVLSGLLAFTAAFLWLKRRAAKS